MAASVSGRRRETRTLSQLNSCSILYPVVVFYCLVVLPVTAKGGHLRVITDVNWEEILTGEWMIELWVAAYLKLANISTSYLCYKNMRIIVPYGSFSGRLTNFSALHNHLTRIIIKMSYGWIIECIAFWIRWWGTLLENRHLHFYRLLIQIDLHFYIILYIWTIKD